MEMQWPFCEINYFEYFECIFCILNDVASGKQWHLLVICSFFLVVKQDFHAYFIFLNSKLR